MKTNVIRIAPWIIPCLALCLSQNARAGVIVNITEVGANVVATGSGSFNTASLSFDLTISNVTGFMQPAGPELVVGSNGTVSRYSGFNPVGPAAFGIISSPISASSGTGSLLGFGEFPFSSVHAGFLVVPNNYISGNPLSGTATWDNDTFISLGIDPGSYTWTWAPVCRRIFSRST